MLRFGICDRDQFRRIEAQGKLRTSAVSYSLLKVDDDAGDEDLRMFEAISLRLRTSNGTVRMTFANRFRDVDEVASRILQVNFDPKAALRIQDRAVSHGLTSYEWAQRLFVLFPDAQIEASDRILNFYRIALPNGDVYILEPDGQPIQYIRPPFVISMAYREPFRFPLNHLIAMHAKKQFRKSGLGRNWKQSADSAHLSVDQICCIHPRARQLSKADQRFRICARSVFDPTPGLDVLRTMNILNRDYFSADQLTEGATAAFRSLNPGGIWILGRTLEEDSSNHVTFLKRTHDGWEILQRIGRGSEIEELALRAPASSSRRNS